MTDAPAAPSSSALPLELVLISGMAGSGKSLALHALEDAGYYCVDNLPPELLGALAQRCRANGNDRVAVAVDARSARSLPLIPQYVQLARDSGAHVSLLFLDADDATLMRRFSETRRKHPLTRTNSNGHDQDLREAIALERTLLADIRAQALLVDTTMTRAAQLRSHIKELLAATGSHLTLVLASFAFKRGVPTDADYVFDVRMLPNPYYDLALRSLTGRDAPVAAFLRAQSSAQLMRQHIGDFLRHWLPALARDHRSYVTVAIGCTGGQHRSVWLVEALQREFAADWVCLKRHRELDAQ